MQSASCKAKGRALQVAAAEAIGARFMLSIEAVPPTKIGFRNGVTYVPEGVNADLRVRRMGEAGTDIALLSLKAQRRVVAPVKVAPTTMRMLVTTAYIECKKVEAFNLGAAAWTGKPIPVLNQAFDQVMAAKPAGVRPLIILSRNRWPMLAAFDAFGSDTMLWCVARLSASGTPVFVIEQSPARWRVLTTLDGYLTMLERFSPAFHWET